MTSQLSTSKRPRALIVGMGIAGMSTAIRLHEIGWESVLIERAEGRRRGGHFIALFGAGRAAAERLGVLDGVENRAAPDGRSWEVSRDGRKRPGLGMTSIAAAPWLILRTDVEQALHDRLPDDLEIRFRTTPTDIRQDVDGADVTLLDLATGAESNERFDMVVGSDGIRSTVRQLAFGPDANFVHPLNYMNATTLLDSNLTGFRPQDSMVFAEPGRSVWTFAFENHAPSVLFSYRVRDPEWERKRNPVDSIRDAFARTPTGPILGEVIERYAQAEETSFFTADQVRMKQFYSGRVVLVGDAAWCLTLYSGFGASSSLAGGDLLGRALALHGNDVPKAAAQWNGWMLPHVAFQHESIGRSRTLFTPHDRKEHIARKTLIRALNAPMIGALAQKGLKGDSRMARKDKDIASSVGI